MKTGIVKIMTKRWGDKGAEGRVGYNVWMDYSEGW